MSKIRIVRFSLLVMLIFISVVSSTSAQETVQTGDLVAAQCGDIIESEFKFDFEEMPFQIDLAAGDSLNVSVVPVGKSLKTGLMINGPTNLGIAISNGKVTPDKYTNFEGKNPEPKPILNSDILSASGSHTIRVVNFEFLYYIYDSRKYVNLNGSGGVGAYTLNIGCTLRDGTVINPGDTLAPVPTPVEIVTPSTPVFSGNGFPGLPPVDFSGAFKVSLSLREPNEGEIPTIGNNVLAFKFKANANDKMNLSFTRTTGNLNLGLVVLSSTNQVIYMVALVNSETMSSLFAIPDTGDYLIGVFRLDLLPPPVPENTVFQIQVALNS